MNLSIITAQIVSQPQAINLKKKNIVYMNAIVPNEKKQHPFYRLYIYSTIHKYNKFCELYQVKDIVILKGYIYIRQNPLNTFKSYNYMIMKIDDIQPYIANLK